VIATKRISAAVAGLSLLALVLLRLCPVFHPVLIPLRLVPAFSLFLFLPGFILLNWLLPEMVHSFVEAIPLALAASLAFWAPVLFVMLVLAVSPAILLLVALLALLMLFVAYLVLASNADERDIRLAPAGRGFWIVWFGMALACALVIYKGSFLHNDPTRFHLQIMRRVVDGTHLSLGYVAGRSVASSRSYIFPLWHIVEALISMLAGIEPAHIWYYEPSLLVPTTMLAIYLLTKALFKSEPIASLSTPVYLLASFYSVPPFSLWSFSSYPGEMNLRVFLPVVLAVLVHYLQDQSSRVWVLGGAVFVLGFAMGAIHASELLYMLAWLVVFLATYPLLIGWNRPVLMRAAVIVLIFVLSFVVVFWFADTWLDPDHDLSYFETIRRDNEDRAPRGYESCMDVTPPCSVATATALFPLLLAIGRKRIPLAVAFLFAWLITPPLLRLEPHILSVAMQVIPHLWAMCRRVEFLVCVPIITTTITALLSLLDRRVAHLGVLMVRRMSARARWVGFVGICTTGALLVWLITRCQFLKDWVLRDSLRLSPPPFFAYLAFVVSLVMLARFRSARGGPPGKISRAWRAEVELRHPSRMVMVVAACLASLAIPGLFWLEPLKGQPLLESDMNTEAMAARFLEGSAAVAWDPRFINFLRNHTTEDAMIWSESEYHSWLIQVYVNRRAPEPHWLNNRIEKLRQRDPTYVVFFRPSAPSNDMDDLIYLSRAFRADGGLFEQVYESAQVTLFRMSPTSQRITELQLNHVLAGNAYFVGEEWDKATARYKAALALDPDDPLAHLGLGRAYQARGEMEKAIAELERAMAASQEDAGPQSQFYLGQVYFYLGEAYASSEEMVETDSQTHLQEAAEAYRRSEVYRRPWALNWENTAAGERLVETCEKLEDWCQQAGIFDDVVAHFEKAAESNPSSLSEK